jgi:hypothetical protein
MPNPGPNVQGLPNSMPESIAIGSNVVYTFATLPPAANFGLGFVALTSDLGLCVVESVAGVNTWVAIGHGSLLIEAGTNSVSSGTVSFANSNGVTFGMNTAGVITATVTPGAAAGIGAIQLPNTTYTSGTANFINSNGISFGSTTGGGVTASYNSTQFAGLGTTFAGTNVSGSMALNSNGLALSISSPTESGVGISANGSSQSAGNILFSNANGVSFGMNGSTVTASAAGGGVNASLGGNTSGVLALISTGTLFLAGGNNVTLSQNGNSVTISANTAAAANLSVSAGTTTGAFGGLTFSNSNGFSFGLNNGTITGSYNSTQFAGTGTTFAGTNVSGSMTLNSAGLNLALSGAAGSSQTEAIYFAGNTTGQSSQSTYTVGSLNVSGAGIISAGWSSNSLIISAPATTAFNLSAYAVSNTTQSSSGTVAGTALSFAGAGGASVGISNGSVVISAGAAGGASTAGLYALGNTTQNSSTTLNQSALSFNALGAMTWGYSNGSIQVSAPATSSISGTGLVSISVNGSTISIGANALTAYAVSNTTQSSSGTVNGTALSFAGAGGVSVGVSNGSVVVSGAAGGAGSVNFSAGTTSSNLGSVVFSNSNGVSFGLNGSTITASANGISTVGLYALGNTTQNSSTTLNQSALSFNGLGIATVGYSNGSIQISASQLSTLGLYAVGNTTQNSSTSLAQNTVSFDGLGALSVGFSNGSIQLSAPATSSLSATGMASISVNGSTISIGAAIPQLSFFQPLGPAQNTTVTQNGLGSVQVYPAIAAFPFTASRVDMMASVSLSALVLSTQAQTLSLYVGLYSLNGSTLSLASSGSQSYAWTNNSNGSSASLSGIRRFSAPINVNYTGGFDLFVGMMSNTTFANSNAISLSNVVVPLGPGPQLQGLIGQTQVNSMQFVPGQGFYSASSAALPSSMGLSQILGAGSGGNAVDYYAPVQFVNMTA